MSFAVDVITIAAYCCLYLDFTVIFVSPSAPLLYHPFPRSSVPMLLSSRRKDQNSCIYVCSKSRDNDESKYAAFSPTTSHYRSLYLIFTCSSLRLPTSFSSLPYHPVRLRIMPTLPHSRRLHQSRLLGHPLVVCFPLQARTHVFTPLPLAPPFPLFQISLPQPTT